MPASLLTGTCCRYLDRKGRVVIPHHLRDNRLGESFFLSPLSGHRVLAFHERDLNTLLDLRPVLVRDLSLSLVWQVEAEPTNSRIMLPELLRKHLQIKPGREIAVSGVGEAVVLCEWHRWITHYAGVLGQEKPLPPWKAAGASGG